MLLAGALLALGWRGPGEGQGHRVGLFTTLPLLWSESGDVSAEVAGVEPPHWARDALARKGELVPLDTLTGSLAGLDRMVIAQPRILQPRENVALDAWVRGGGHLLLIADPLLTEESALPLGDPRRPQGTVLLSPILSHWDLELRFDEHQPPGEMRREVMGVAMPVDLPGHFATRGQANCRLWGEGLAVTCAIGKGRVVALADAALLDREDGDGARAGAFAWLLDAAFAGR